MCAQGMAALLSLLPGLTEVCIRESMPAEGHDGKEEISFLELLFGPAASLDFAPNLQLLTLLRWWALDAGASSQHLLETDSALKAQSEAARMAE
jgi:hypothetical protein